MSIVLMQECRTNEGYQPIQVQSDSDPDVTYTVLAASWLAPKEFICDCKSFQFRNSCKHQRKAALRFCRWNELDGPEEQTPDQKKKKVCPRCGGETRHVMEETDDR